MEVEAGEVEAGEVEGDLAPRTIVRGLLEGVGDVEAAGEGVMGTRAGDELICVMKRSKN